MKKSKKVISIFIVSAIMMSTMSTMSFAFDNKSIQNVNNEPNILTTINDKNEIIRVFERETHELNNIYDIDDTKDLLLELGMEQYAIDNLSDSDLERYAKSPKIITSVSYSKVNKDGDIIYLDEASAINESKAIIEQQNAKFQNIANGIQTVDQDTYEDSYMRVFYATTYNGDGMYTFSTDARWLSMPWFRSKDVIGSTAQDCTVDYKTRSGYVQYDRTLSGTGIYDVEQKKYNLSSNDFQEVSDGNFYGSGVIIDLPSDVINKTGTSMYYRNYKAHYQYNGYLLDPDTSHRFNTVGSYSHSKVSISISPSIGIDIDGISGSIGIEGNWTQEVRDVKLQINYQK